MRPLRVVLLIFGGLLALLGLLFLAPMVGPFTMALGFFLLVAAGGLIHYSLNVLREPFEPEAYEAQVIELARRKKGRLTVNEVAGELGMPVSMAREVLRGLGRRGSCFMDLEEVEKQGVEVYVFPEYRGPSS